MDLFSDQTPIKQSKMHLMDRLYSLIRGYFIIILLKHNNLQR